MIRDTKQLMTDAYGAGFDAGRQAGLLEGSTPKARSISRKQPKSRAKAINTGHPAASPAPPEGGTTTQVQHPQRKARKSPKRARSSVQQQQGTSA